LSRREAVDNAVVLAALGLAVAPYDLEATRIPEKPSNHIDTVLALFSRDETGSSDMTSVMRHFTFS
jgi:hypothetical protein